MGLTLDKVESKEIIEVLKGEKGITDSVRNFFATPEWQNIIKKYGADFTQYPKTILFRKEAKPLEVIIEGAGQEIKSAVEKEGIKGLLPENILFKKLDEAF